MQNIKVTPLSYEYNTGWQRVIRSSETEKLIQDICSKVSEILKKLENMDTLVSEEIPSVIRGLDERILTVETKEEGSSNHQEVEGRLGKIDRYLSDVSETVSSILDRDSSLIQDAELLRCEFDDYRQAVDERIKQLENKNTALEEKVRYLEEHRNISENKILSLSQQVDFLKQEIQKLQTQKKGIFSGILKSR